MYKIYGRLEQAIAPDVRPSQHVYLDILRREIPFHCAWLDLGCGHQLFGSWMVNEELEIASRAQILAGIDRDEAAVRKHQTLHLRVIGDLAGLPFSGELYDVVTANMVMEHVEDVDSVLAEVSRVLKSGGKFIFHTPNRHSFQNALLRNMPQTVKNKLALALEGRKEEDVFPTHYLFNTAEEIRRSAQRHSFAIDDIILCNSSAQTAVLGPFSVPELVLLRVLQRPEFGKRRTNLIATLSKTVAHATVGSST